MKQKIIAGVIVVFPLLLTAWLFFDFAAVSLILLAYLPIAVGKRKKEEIRKQKWELNLAFKDALVCMENSLAVGYSPESSVRESIKNLEQLYGKEHSICLEFRRMTQQMELGYSMEQAFMEFAQRSDIEDVKQLADIFVTVKRTGGNLGQVLRQTGQVLQDKIELKRELRTVIAGKQMEFQIMSLVPYGILFYLKVCAPAMSAGLYHNWFGIFFMWVMLALYLSFKAWGEHIVHNEIGKLEAGS